MNLFYRSVVFILTILFMFFCLLMSIYSFGFTRSILLPDMVLSFYKYEEIGFLFLLGFIAGAFILYPFFRSEKKTTLISSSELGDVTISLDALDKLIYGISIQQEGVVDISTNLKANDDGLHIFLRGNVLPNIPLPELTSNLQTIVKSYTEDTTGVTVAQVRVLVEGVSEENKLKDE